mgnify:CR=1 FL=1
MGIIWLLLKITLVLLLLLLAGLILALFSPLKARIKGLLTLPQNDAYTAWLKVTWIYGLLAFELEAVPAGMTRRFKLAGFTVKEEETPSERDDDPGNGPSGGGPLAGGTPGLTGRGQGDEIVFDLALFGMDPDVPPEKEPDRSEEDSDVKTVEATEGESGKLAKIKMVWRFLKEHDVLIRDLLKAFYILGRDFLRSFQLRLELLRMDMSLTDLAMLGQLYGLTASLQGVRPDLFGAIQIVPDFQSRQDTVDIDTRGEIKFSMFNCCLSGTRFFLRPCVWKASWLGFKHYRQQKKREKE